MLLQPVKLKATGTVRPLTPAQLDRLGDAIASAGPLELNQLLTPFERSQDEQLGLKLLSKLKEADALPSLRVDVVRRTLAKYGSAVQQGVDELESLLNLSGERK